MTIATETHLKSAQTLAAIAAAIHRRTGKDFVSIRFGSTGSAGDPAQHITLRMHDDPVLHDLAGRVLDLLSTPETDSPSPVRETEPDAIVGLAEDASIVSLDVPAEPDGRRDDQAIHAQIEAALAAGTQAPDIRVSRMNLMRAADFTRLAGWAGRAAAARDLRPVPELIAAHAARTPDAIAVSHEAGSMTYRALDRRSRALAGELRGRGVVSGAVVGVLMHRSSQLIVTLLAVLRAGGAYLALDPDDHQTHHARLLSDAGAGLVVADPELRDAVPPDVAALVRDPDADAAATDAAATDAAATDDAGNDAATTGDGGIDAATAGDLAYISYTSGSTGEPKGVAVPHRAVARLVTAPDWMSIAPDDVFLQLAPVSFDASTLEIWGPLANGARLAVHPAGPVDLEQVARVLKDERVTVLWLTAGLFHQMVGAHLDAFAGLRHVLAGGDVVSPNHLGTLLAAHPQLIFSNGYGPTENTTFTTCWTTREAPAAGTSVPIGKPISGTSVAVLDADMRPVPVGVRGELYAAGAGLADGYLNWPGTTAERFVPSPDPGQPGQRLYRTGDLVRWLPTGDLEFLGRVDHQIKVSGFRVEPGAVEAELTRLPGVQQAAVVAQPDGAGGKRLLAYVALAGGFAGDSPAAGIRLREKLAGTLPAYMVPLAVLVRPSLPLNANGKVDRNALPSATRVPRNVWNDFVAARTPLESVVADVWGDLLGIEPIGVEDDFFDLGGHSLLAVDMIETLRRELDVDLQARVLYVQPTIAELAQNLITLRPSLEDMEVRQS